MAGDVRNAARSGAWHAAVRVRGGGECVGICQRARIRSRCLRTSELILSVCERNLKWQVVVVTVAGLVIPVGSAHECRSQMRVIIEVKRAFEQRALVGDGSII